MRAIRPAETEIAGAWAEVDGRVVADDACRRIDELVSTYMQRLGSDTSGWDVLYRDPGDGRLWELTYPLSSLHGGGPPLLRHLADGEAARKYGRRAGADRAQPDSLPGVAGSLPLADFDGSGNLLREYVWDPQAAGGIGGLVLLRAYVGNAPTDAERLYAEFRPVCDFRGNVVGLVGMDGALAEWYQYDGFGRVRFFDSQGELTGSVVGNPFLFSTKPYDEALTHGDVGVEYAADEDVGSYHLWQ